MKHIDIKLIDTFNKVIKKIKTNCNKFASNNNLWNLIHRDFSLKSIS